MVADLFSLLAQTASPKGEAEKGRIAQSASTERKAVALERAKPRGQERFRGVRA